MVGLSHVALRSLIREYLPSDAETLWPTEMLNSRRLPYQHLGQTPETLKAKGENNLVPQVLGNRERFLIPSLAKLKEWGASAIDINMGCPVTQALKHNYGVALMGDPQYAKQVVQICTDNTDLPVSVKLRSAKSHNQQALLDFVGGLQEAGASWITLHPRTGEEKRKADVNWDEVTFLKKNLHIPVIGNGEIQTAEQAIQVKNKYRCDGIMVGRALCARPWLLWQIGEQLGLSPPEGKKGPAPKSPSEEAKEYFMATQKFIRYCYQYFEGSRAKRRVRFFLRMTSMWINYGHSVEKKLAQVENYQQQLELLEQFARNDNFQMSPETQLTI